MEEAKKRKAPDEATTEAASEAANKRRVTGKPTEVGEEEITASQEADLEELQRLQQQEEELKAKLRQAEELNPRRRQERQQQLEAARARTAALKRQLEAAQVPAAKPKLAEAAATPARPSTPSRK